MFLFNIFNRCNNNPTEIEEELTQICIGSLKHSDDWKLDKTSSSISIYNETDQFRITFISSLYGFFKRPLYFQLQLFPEQYNKDGMIIYDFTNQHYKQIINELKERICTEKTDSKFPQIESLYDVVISFLKEINEKESIEIKKFINDRNNGLEKELNKRRMSTFNKIIDGMIIDDMKKEQ